ncbi:mitochondrial fission factor homolog A-like isoform X2 [Embiotoca jacksoni]|uniref:mitochondrial fission factor homolog A-like isoform X2 n=1 Tax=Embiotoca jacksoni TaxID=100190 RepID=UPI003703A354
MCQVPGHDPAFMEAINKNMRVPERLSVVPGQRWREEEEEEEPPPAYVMQVPDRLTYTEAPDMSPRPLFTLSKPVGGPLGLEPCWESPPEEAVLREGSQSSMRRSYSDQSFGRTPPGTPTHKQALVPSRHPSSLVVDSWSPEDEGGAAVEFIILRRQVMKMSRRLAALEKQSCDQRNTEALLFSLLFSTCLLNMWLWIRR